MTRRNMSTRVRVPQHILPVSPSCVLDDPSFAMDWSWLERRGGGRHEVEELGENWLQPPLQLHSCVNFLLSVPTIFKFSVRLCSMRKGDKGTAGEEGREDAEVWGHQAAPWTALAQRQGRLKLFQLGRSAIIRNHFFPATRSSSWFLPHAIFCFRTRSTTRTDTGGQRCRASPRPWAWTAAAAFLNPPPANATGRTMPSDWCSLSSSLDSYLLVSTKFFLQLSRAWTLSSKEEKWCTPLWSSAILRRKV